MKMTFYMLGIKEFNLDPASISVCIGGEITLESKLYTLLNGYLKKIVLVDQNLKTNNRLQHAKHLFYDLYLCRACV